MYYIIAPWKNYFACCITTDCIAASHVFSVTAKGLVIDCQAITATIHVSLLKQLSQQLNLKKVNKHIHYHLWHPFNSLPLFQDNLSNAAPERLNNQSGLWWNKRWLGGSGISRTICTSFAPCSRQITTPAPHHFIFTGRMLFLTPNQQCQSTEDRSKHWRKFTVTCDLAKICMLFFCFGHADDWRVPMSSNSNSSQYCHTTCSTKHIHTSEWRPNELADSKQELIRRWDSERGLLRSTTRRYLNSLK